MDILASMDWATIGDYVIVFLVGAVVSSGELISRYRDQPFATLRSRAALFYMLVNGLASMGALTLVRAFNLTFGASGNGVRLMQILVAGFGAMAVFRSSIFTVRIDDTDVPIGAASFLTIVLAAADREVDRQRATLRAQNVGRIMEAVDFKKAIASLPTYSIALMQNLPEVEQKKLLADILELAKAEEVDDPVKAQILGLAVMNFMGEDVLEASIDALKDEIKSEKSGVPKPSEGGLNLDKILRGQREGEKAASQKDSPYQAPSAGGLDMDKILDRVRSEGAKGTTPKETPAEELPVEPAPSKLSPPGISKESTSEKAASLDFDSLIKRAQDKTSAEENKLGEIDSTPKGDEGDKHSSK